VQDAFATAVERWPRDGTPANPGAWILTAARNRAIERIRRDRTLAGKRELLARLEAEAPPAADMTADAIPDERLSLVFACCHPALATEAQVALTLRLLGGLTTEEIARAFLVPEPTMAQRLTRAKRKVRAAGIPVRVPAAHELPDRLRAVHAVLYLVFNQGYGPPPRDELLDEAIRLGKLLAVLMPDDAETLGLLALMLLHDARRAARLDMNGDLVLLEDQVRTLWDRGRIDEGRRMLDRAIRLRRPGPYQLQAAIAAVHAEALDAAKTDWTQIVGLYDVLLRVEPTPVVELNRAVAVAMRDGPIAGLELIEAILNRGDLTEYHLAHSAHAELCRRLGRMEQARHSYQRALRLARQEPERRFLQRRLDTLGA